LVSAFQLFSFSAFAWTPFSFSAFDLLVSAFALLLTEPKRPKLWVDPFLG
jgi:hypothetical protein